MKISPPKLKIDDSKPFDDALFGRQEFATSLTLLIRSISDNLVIFVNAPWGAGKTTFSSMWRSSLRHEGLDVIYFDAYAADYFDDPFVSFSGEILGLIDKRFPEQGRSLSEGLEFKKTAVEVGKRLVGLGTKIALRAATLGAIESAHIEELKDLGTDIATGISDIGADVVEERIQNYCKEKDALQSFKASLAKLAAKVREKQNFPLTIIVDELDRCRPSFALELLERIKHLFDVENVAFVLLVNRDQIESYIKTVYGDVDARSYLLKFGTLFVDLPNEVLKPSIVYMKGHREYCESLFNYYGLNAITPNGRFLITWMSFCFRHFNVSLREMERIFGMLTVYYSASSDPGRSEGPQDFLVTLLSILKVKQPSIYHLMRKGNITAEGFYEQTKLDIMQVDGDSFNPEWAKGSLDCFIMSDEEFKAATAKNDSAKKVSGWLPKIAETYSDRRRVIPYFCNQLDRFAVS